MRAQRLGDLRERAPLSPYRQLQQTFQRQEHQLRVGSYLVSSTQEGPCPSRGHRDPPAPPHRASSKRASDGEGRQPYRERWAECESRAKQRLDRLKLLHCRRYLALPMLRLQRRPFRQASGAIRAYICHEAVAYQRFGCPLKQLRCEPLTHLSTSEFCRRGREGAALTVSSKRFGRVIAQFPRWRQMQLPCCNVDLLQYYEGQRNGLTAQ